MRGAGLTWLAWDNVRHSWRSQAATALAVGLSTAFVVVVLALAGGLSRAVEDSSARPLSTADVVIGCDAQQGLCPPAGALLKVVADVPGVGAAAADSLSYRRVRADGNEVNVVFGPVLPEPLRYDRLTAGAWPVAGRAQVALEADTAQALGAGVGTSLTLTDPVGGKAPQTLEVVGLLESQGLGAGRGVSGLEDGAEGSTVLLSAQDPDQAPALARAVGDALAAAGTVADPQDPSRTYDLGAAQVLTGEQARQDAVARTTQNADSNSQVLLVFAMIAVLLSVAIVSTTSQVTLRRRTRQTGLLRCTGATTGQVRRLLVVESALVGLASGVLGLLLSLPAVMVLLTTTGICHDAGEALGTVTPASAASALVLAVVVCVLASLRAVSAAARTSPMAVLAGAGGAQGPRTRRRSLLTWGLTALLVVLGAALVAWGAASHGQEAGSGASSLLATLAGGVALLVALVVAMTRATPATGTLVARLLGRWEAGHQGALGLRRSGGRAGATGAMMLVGVVLVTATLVGAASMRASVGAEIDRRRPVDVVVHTDAEAGWTASQVSQIESVAGVSASAPMRCLRATDADGVTASPVQLTAVDPGQWAGVTRRPTDQVSAGSALVDATSPWAGRSRLSLTLGSGTTLSLPVSTLASRTLGADQVRVALSDLPVRVAQEAPTCAVWLRTVDGMSGGEFQRAQAALLRIDPDMQVGGGLAERVSAEKTLGQVLTAVMGLLAVSLLVCVVGLVNVLGLGVAERRRELAVLRAVGMSRSQVCGVVMTEGVVLALTSLLLGLAAGTGLGTLGSHAVLALAGGLGTQVTVPWGQVVLLAVATLVVAALASAVPAAGASRISPVEAMARE